MSSIDIKKWFKVSKDSKEQLFFTVPYVKGVSKKFFKITKKHGLNLAYSNTNSLGKFIKKDKNKLNSAQCCNIVL